MQIHIFLILTAILLTPRAQSDEIIGGREAKPHSRPYMAFLNIQRRNNSSRCGGFLVSKNFVLTAAHCKGEKIMVYLGAHNISNKKEQSQQVIPVSGQFPHPQFDRFTLNNDIMLLKLKHKAKLTKEVDLITLPSAHRKVLLWTRCRVAGWGRTSLTDRTDTLQEVSLKVIRDKTCKEQYGEYYHPSSMLCGGDPHDKKTIYWGDSGGPLVCHGVAEGVVSYCAKNSIAPPAVYTWISHFMSWITETMRRI